MNQVTLTMEDRKTLEVLIDLDNGRCTAASASEQLGLGVRQVRRKLAAFRQEGVASIPHKNRDRKPAHAIPEKTRAAVIALSRDRYFDCNDHHFQELLSAREGIHLSVPSVRRIRREAGLASPRKRRAPKHRTRRERKPRAGMMLQIDGSPFRWLGDQGPKLMLLAAIDDATNEVFAHFRYHEDTVGYLLLLEKVLAQRGIPWCLYSDHDSVFVVNPKAKPDIEDELAGKAAQTQFGRAAQELGIRQSNAGSPQAKGRVEKLHNTLQGRLTVEMRLAGITTIEQANAFLPEFLQRYNAAFMKPPQDPDAAYRCPPADEELEQILCLRFPRVVANDHTISFGGRRLDLPKPLPRSYAKARIILQVALDGQISYWYQSHCLGEGPRAEGELRVHPSAITALLPNQPTPQPALPPKPKKPSRRQPTAVTPAPDHPWRRYRSRNQPQPVVQSPRRPGG